MFFFHSYVSLLDFIGVSENWGYNKDNKDIVDI